jgi:hypothetical protein
MFCPDALTLPSATVGFIEAARVSLASCVDACEGCLGRRIPIMESPTDSANQAGGSGTKKDEAIGDLLKRLGLEEDELNDLVFEEEEFAPKQGMKWMALLRIHTTNQFRPITFEQHMRNVWSPAQQLEFNHLGR